MHETGRHADFYTEQLGFKLEQQAGKAFAGVSLGKLSGLTVRQVRSGLESE